MWGNFSMIYEIDYDVPSDRVLLDGGALRYARKSKNMTARELADAAKISQGLQGIDRGGPAVKFSYMLPRNTKAKALNMVLNSNDRYDRHYRAKVAKKLRDLARYQESGRVFDPYSFRAVLFRMVPKPTDASPRYDLEF